MHGFQSLGILKGKADRFQMNNRLMQPDSLFRSLKAHSGVEGDNSRAMEAHPRATETHHCSLGKLRGSPSI